MSDVLNADGTPVLDAVHHADALTLLRALPDGCADLAVTDPPYGIGYKSSRKTRLNGEPRIAAASFGEDKINTNWLGDLYRVLKQNSTLYIFTRWDVINLWREAIECAGFVVAQRLIWYKAHWKMGDLRYFGSQTEDILFCRKGNPYLRWNQREGNIWYSASALYQGDKYWDHPTQKPLRLIGKAIRYSSDPGDLVVDPFVGSGTTALAARNAGRRFICGDLDAGYVETARARLAEPYTLPMFDAIDTSAPPRVVQRGLFEEE